MAANLHPDKQPFRVLRKWNVGGVRHVEYEADFWEGPDGSDGPIGYRTVRSTVNAPTVRNTASPNVSFWTALSTALGL